MRRKSRVITTTMLQGGSYVRGGVETAQKVFTPVTLYSCCAIGPLRLWGEGEETRWSNDRRGRIVVAMGRGPMRGLAIIIENFTSRAMRLIAMSRTPEASKDTVLL